MNECGKILLNAFYASIDKSMSFFHLLLFDIVDVDCFPNA